MRTTGIVISRMTVRKVVKTAPTAKIGKVNLPSRDTPSWTISIANVVAVAIDTPPPAHDELDTAE
jgi:hypothetical protein